MLKLLRLLNDYKKETALAPAFKLLEALFELFVPLVIAQIIDVGISSSDASYTVKMCLVLILLGFIGFAASVIAQFFSAKASVCFAGKLRSAMFNKIQEMSYSELDKAGTASLITHMTSDINQIQSGVNLTLRLFLRSPCIVFGAMIMAFTIDVKLALIFVAMIAILSAIVFAIILGTVPLYKRVQNNLSKVTRSVRENLTGVRILRGFCKESSEVEKFIAQTDELKHSQNYVSRISSLMNPLTYVVVNVAIIGLIQGGAVTVNSGRLSQGELVAMYNYMTQILVELVKLANLIITITKSIACGQRISAVMDGINDKHVGNVRDLNTSGSCPKVEFRGVKFRYDSAGDDSLTDITFKAYPGETVGIIGGTGAGKSTLVSLIPCFYKATEGQVLIDGVDVRDINEEILREKVSVVPQSASMFNGSIRDNLNFRDPKASDLEILKAAEIAQARVIIESKSGLLDAMSKQMGKNFSGGQRQRLTIARALLGDPEILILDDSSSALDYATEAALKRSLDRSSASRTTFIVSQRTSSIMNADKIIVLEDGCIIGLGTHTELLSSCDEYREIHNLQFGAEKGGDDNEK